MMRRWIIDSSSGIWETEDSVEYVNLAWMFAPFYVFAGFSCTTNVGSYMVE